MNPDSRKSRPLPPAAVMYASRLLATAGALIAALIVLPLVERIVLAPVLVGLVLGWFYFRKALQHRSALGQADLLKVLGLKGLPVGPEYYTELGWRYRNRALTFSLLGFVIFLILTFVLYFRGQL